MGYSLLEKCFPLKHGFKKAFKKDNPSATYLLLLALKKAP